MYGPCQKTRSSLLNCEILRTPEVSYITMIWHASYDMAFQTVGGLVGYDVQFVGRMEFRTNENVSHWFTRYSLFALRMRPIGKPMIDSMMSNMLKYAWS